jgi:hypothetical protein
VVGGRELAHDARHVCVDHRVISQVGTGICPKGSNVGQPAGVDGILIRAAELFTVLFNLLFLLLHVVGDGGDP